MVSGGHGESRQEELGAIVRAPVAKALDALSDGCVSDTLRFVGFPVRIAGSGLYVPRTLVTAEDLDRQLGLTAGTSLARNGVAKRYFASKDETSSAMGASAVSQALESAQWEASTLDAILFSGVMPEQPMPSTAILIHQRLGGRAVDVTCFDINASCAGFLKGLEVAAAAISTGLWQRVAVVAVEICSKGLRWDDLEIGRASCRERVLTDV